MCAWTTARMRSQWHIRRFIQASKSSPKSKISNFRIRWKYLTENKKIYEETYKGFLDTALTIHNLSAGMKSFLVKKTVCRPIILLIDIDDICTVETWLWYLTQIHQRAINNETFTKTCCLGSMLWLVSRCFPAMRWIRHGYTRSCNLEIQSLQLVAICQILIC